MGKKSATDILIAERLAVKDRARLIDELGDVRAKSKVLEKREKELKELDVLTKLRDGVAVVGKVFAGYWYIGANSQISRDLLKSRHGLTDADIDACMTTREYRALKTTPLAQYYADLEKQKGGA